MGGVSGNEWVVEIILSVSKEGERRMWRSMWAECI